MRFLRSIGAFSGMTAISRVFGLARDVLMAAFFGIGAIADAFFLAFRIPNAFRRLFAEGAFSQAFLPVFAALQKKNVQQASHFALMVLVLLALVVAVLVIILTVFAENWLRIIAAGMSGDAYLYGLAVDLLQLLMPFLWFTAIVSWQSAILQSKQIFALPAAMPIVLNSAMLSALGLAILLGWSQERAVFTLSGAVLLSGALQVVFFVATKLSLFTCDKCRVQDSVWAQS